MAQMGKNFINITGERFSGKTHLINIFLKKNKGIKIDASHLNNMISGKSKFMKILL